MLRNGRAEVMDSRAARSCPRGRGKFAWRASTLRVKVKASDGRRKIRKRLGHPRRSYSRGVYIAVRVRSSGAADSWRRGSPCEPKTWLVKLCSMLPLTTHRAAVSSRCSRTRRVASSGRSTASTGRLNRSALIARATSTSQRCSLAATLRSMSSRTGATPR